MRLHANTAITKTEIILVRWESFDIYAYLYRSSWLFIFVAYKERELNICKGMLYNIMHHIDDFIANALG